jgi:ABC-2 type transport system permease protein
MKTSKYLVSAYWTEWKKILQYPVEFIGNQLLKVLVEFFLAYIIWSSIFEYQNVEIIQGFTLTEMMAYYLLASTLNFALLGSQIGMISQEIYQGHLTKFLLYPVQFLFFKLSTYLAHSSLFLIQLITVYFAYQFYTDTWSVAPLLLGLIQVIIAIVCFFFMASILEQVAFWVEYVWSLMVFLRYLMQFLGGMMIPLDLFPPAAQAIIKLTPFPYLIYYPVQTFLGRTDLSAWAWQCFVAVFWSLCFALIANWVWSIGKKHYTGVGI